MAGSFIPTGIQDLWSVWNVRGFVILSLFLQVLLAFMARLRKKSNNRLIIFVIWSAYFMAAFLLIHLGGPDSITAFSLEGNALWMRHLVGLVAQVFTFLYIFLKTLPDNNLIVPTILVAITGAFKYGERTRALYLASIENLKKSIGKPPDTSLDSSYSNESREAFHFFQIFKGLVVDIMPPHAERSHSREFILGKGAQEAFHLMVWELNFLYELFYTKIVAVTSAWGLLACTITYYNIVAALVLYCFSRKDGFHEVDICITFLLMAGVVALETLNELMLAVSDWNIRTSFWYNRIWVIAQGLFMLTPLSSRGFVASITDGNILRNAFGEEIQNFIFDELKGKALFANDDDDKVKTVFEARGSWTLMNSENNRDLMRGIDRFDYDRSLLAWHVTTKICYNTDGAVDATESNHKELAKILSGYMSYLLIKKPEMMSVMAGIGHIRYRDTCSEITLFCMSFESKTVNKFRTRVVDEIASSEPAHEYKNEGSSM